MPLGDIYSGYKSAVRGLESQSSGERDRVVRQYDKQRDTLQRQLGTTERDIQRALGSIRSAERKEQRKRDLPTTRPRDLGTAARLADVRKQGEDIQRNIRDAQSRIAQARGESLADLERQVQRERDRLSAWYRDAKSAQREYEAEVKTVASTPFAGGSAGGGVGSATPSFTGAKAKAKAGSSQSMAEVMASINAAVTARNAQIMRESQSASGSFTDTAPHPSPTSIIGVPLTGKQRTIASMSQSQLKAEYNRYKARPFWQKLIFDPAVIKGPNDTYVGIASGYAPAITGVSPFTSTRAIWQAPKLSKSLTSELDDLVRGIVNKGKSNILEPAFATYKPRPDMATRTWEVEHADAVQFLDSLLARQTPAVVVTATTGAVRLTSTTRNAMTTALKLGGTTATSVAAALGLQAAVDAQAKGMTMPQVKQATQQAIEQMSAVSPRTSTVIDVKAATKQALAQLTKVRAQAATGLVKKLSTVTDTSIKVAPSTAPVTRVVTSTSPLTSTKAQAKLSTPALTAVQTATTPVTPTGTTPTTPQPTKPIIIPLPDGTSVSLTREQYAGIVAWRQGIFYIIAYPPYGKSNIIYTRKPVRGITYARGIDSAQRSATVVGGGRLPHSFEVAMGITKVRVSPGAKRGKPKLTYRQRKPARPRLGIVRL